MIWGMERACIDLFSGLGGFSLAAASNGVQPVMQVEIEPFCLDGLKRAWPESKHHDDIRTFDAKLYRGVWAVFGGPPCQPASRAGKQGGETDNRWLWPQAVRVVAESEPTWFLFENPPGILDVGIDGIISELERLSYEVQAISIPACAVDSPQDRERIWIIGYRIVDDGERQRARQVNAESEWSPRALVRFVQPSQGEFLGNGQGEHGRLPIRQESRDSAEPSRPTQSLAVANAERAERRPHIEREGRSEQGQHGFGQTASGPAQPAQGGAVANGDQERQTQRSKPESEQIGKHGSASLGTLADDTIACSHWQDYDWLPCPDGKGGTVVRRAPTKLHSLAHELQMELPKGVGNKILAALGNSIVWPIAYEIIKAMIASEEKL